MQLLHYVLKVKDRHSSIIKTLKEQLKMTVLRHEEFKEECEAKCNGPFDGRWSKTMVGYGDESSHFVLEIIFNYNVKSYTKGNNLRSIDIKAPLPRSTTMNFEDYNFNIESSESMKICKLNLNVESITNSEIFNIWSNLLELTVVRTSDQSILFKDSNNFQLELHKVDCVTSGNSYGRLAISCPLEQLKYKELKAKDMNVEIVTPLTELETPGKESVHVLIIKDSSNNEICLVSEESFLLLCQTEPNACENLINVIQETKR